jgi:hypothetical protein
MNANSFFVERAMHILIGCGSDVLNWVGFVEKVDEDALG